MALRRTEACGPLLVVDDDASLRAFVREVLQHAGYPSGRPTRARKLSTSCNGSDLRSSFWIFSCRCSGYEVCRRLLDEGSAPPILFISGERTDALDRVAGLLLGADDYLVKPFSADELLARVRSLLRRSDNGHAVKLTNRELAVMRLLARGSWAHRDRASPRDQPEDRRHACGAHLREARRPQPNRGACCGLPGARTRTAVAAQSAE